jgi:hypothetical protein
MPAFGGTLFRGGAGAVCVGFYFATPISSAHLRHTASLPPIRASTRVCNAVTPLCPHREYKAGDSNMANPIKANPRSLGPAGGTRSRGDETRAPRATGFAAIVGTAAIEFLESMNPHSECYMLRPDAF